MFDDLPRTPGSSDWPGRLRASYTRVLVLNRAVAVGFTVHAGMGVAPTFYVGWLPGSQWRATGIWHVRHALIRNEQGALEAIATYATRLKAAGHACMQHASQTAPPAFLCPDQNDCWAGLDRTTMPAIALNIVKHKCARWLPAGSPTRLSDNVLWH